MAILCKGRAIDFAKSLIAGIGNVYDEYYSWRFAFQNRRTQIQSFVYPDDWWRVYQTRFGNSCKSNNSKLIIKKQVYMKPTFLFIVHKKTSPLSEVSFF